MVFVYDFYPSAETLMSKHFQSGASGGGSFMEGGNGSLNAEARPFQSHKSQMLRQQAMLTQNGLLPESLIWTYVIQMTSALRHIHSAGLACRTLDPTKILVINKTRLLLNCCGIFDVLTYDPTSSNPMAAMAHYQQEDLIALGKIVLGESLFRIDSKTFEKIRKNSEKIPKNFQNSKKFRKFRLLPKIPKIPKIPNNC